jgi:energy-coupling factor transporter ATP-binding protein EcfA2
MKLKDLTVELSGNDNVRMRSINIGPLEDGINFIYGERGAGKSTLRNEIGELLFDSISQTSVDRTSVGCNSITMVVEHNEQRYRLARDSKGTCTATKIDPSNAFQDADGSLHQLPALDRELIDSIAVVAFRDPNSKLLRLHQILRDRFRVPVGPDAAGKSNDAERIQQHRLELQQKIGTLQQEVSQLQSQRTSIEAEIVASRKLSLTRTNELDLRIRELSAQLAGIDPAKIRLEIETLQRDANRLRLEIQAATTTVVATTPSPYLPTLYRLLDEIDQQIREIRTVQSSVQRHRVRLKEEMEFRNGLTIDQEKHPYHRAREILRQIEGRIDHADTRGDQWVEDRGTPDSQQVSRFLDETCRAVRDDLQLLCDELSTQYHELRNRSATHELKELRHNYSHLSDLIQQVLARREQVLSELQTADPQGAEAIHRASPEFCQLAASAGHLAARTRYVGPVAEATPQAESWNTRASDTSLQRQQLAAVESRIATLQASISATQSTSETLTRQISELSLQKSRFSSLSETQSNSQLAQLESRIQAISSEISSLNLQLSQLTVNVVAPHALLITASNILEHLTQGDFTHVWLSPEHGGVEVRDRNSRAFAIGSLTERGLCQLVQLSLVLATNENGGGSNMPLIFDDLFADLEKKRIDATLETISRWRQKTFRQLIVLTQHRFLADRIPEAAVWEIEPESSSEVWRPATRESLAGVENYVTKPITHSVDIDQQEVFFDQPVAEYPASPLPRPYPLSKYPRTTDRERASELSGFTSIETFAEPTIFVHAATPIQNEFAHRTAVVSPSVIGDRLEIAAINESTAVDSLGLLDSEQLRCLSDNAISTVNDFLTFDSQQQSTEFIECYLTGETLEHLRASTWLMMWVPGLAANESRALVACGISDPEHLLTSNIDSLFERVARFLRSPDGRRFDTSGRTLTRDTVNDWQQRLRNNRNFRHQSRPRFQSSREQSRQTQRQHGLRAWSPQDRANAREYDSSDRSRERADRDRTERERIPRARSERDRTRRDRTPREYSNRERPDRQSSRRESRPTRSPRMRTPDNREPRRSAPPIPPRSSRNDSARKPIAVRQSSGRQSLSSRNDAPVSADSAGSTTSNSKTQSNTKPKLRFYLELTDHIEAAPSIGPKTGARFEAIGVYTISDFLKMTAESLAEKLNYKRLNAKLLRQWQNQSRLVCRIPNLRGHDAQLLVGCGIIEAEELASMRPETLFSKVAPFSDTKAGLKIIRNGKKPDLAEIKDWISFAQHNRSLRAA